MYTFHFQVKVTLYSRMHVFIPSDQIAVITDARGSLTPNCKTILTWQLEAAVTRGC